MPLGLNTSKVIGAVKRVVGIPSLPEELRDAEEFYETALHDQKQYLSTWYLNIAYFMGLHWTDWNPQINWLQNPILATWKVRFVANLIMPTIRTEAAKILKANPYISAVPANSTDEAQAGARIGTRVMEAKYYEDAFQRKLYNLVMWFLVCGSSFMWTGWDKNKGKRWSDKVPDPETGEEIDKIFFEGDVFDEVDGPFNVLLEPAAPEDFEEHQRIMRVRVMDVDFIKDKYGVEVNPEPIDDVTMFQFRVASLTGFQRNYALPPAQSKRQLRNVVLVKEFFERPTGKHPNGRHQLYANGVELSPSTSLNFWHMGERALPCAKFDHMTIPGRSWGESIIPHIAPINILYNKMTSQTVENGNLLGRPKIMSPQGALDEQVFTDQPGEVVEYHPVGGHKPEPFKPPEMPQYMIQLRDQLPQLMTEISGIHDAARGKLPRRATSGKAIDLLQDADDTRISLTVKNFGSSLQRVQSIKLALINKNYREERIIKKVGKNHSLEVFKFKGADLRDADTVRIVMSVALSRGAKIQIGMKLAEAKIIPPDMVMKILELGDLNMLYDQDSDQINYAGIESFNMAKGEIHEVMPYEPHDQHIKTHMEFLRRMGPKIPQDAQAIIQEHVEMHKNLMMNVASPTVPPGGGSPNVTPEGPVAPGTPPGMQGGAAGGVV